MNRKVFLLLILMSLIPVWLTAQTYSRKTNLPHLYINTFNKASITSKDVYIYCTLIYVDENDVITQYDSVSIRGRGNSTWNLSKKPYKIKFKEKERFLGNQYANAKKWTLLANAGDKTLIRNALTSEMAKWMGMNFAPAAKFVDLTLNGTYQGNYQISDQIEVKKNRVNIVEQDYPLVSSSNITGGYLLEVDGFKDGNWFTSSKSVSIRIHYPDEDEIATSQSNYIKAYINSFERALFSANFKDPQNGYRAFVDSISMANLYLITEITGNIDGFWSMYFYKNQNDSLLYFGPVWDYDIAYNNDYRIQPTQTKIMVDDGYGDARTWFKQMWNDQEWFTKLINKRYNELLDNGLEQFLYHKIDSLTQLIDESQKTNYSKWSIRTRMYHEIVTHPTYDEYITDLKNFIHEHISYLQTAFANRMPEEPTPPFQPKAFYYNVLNAKTNKALDIYADNGTLFSETNPPQEGSLACTWSLSENRNTQYLKIEPAGDYFIITNQYGLALNDPTLGESTATTNTGTQLNFVSYNPDDKRQQWIITPQGTQGYYNLTNVYTQHTANLNGGNAADGTSVISYTTNERNATSTNRLWYIKKTSLQLPEAIEPEPFFELSLSKGWNWGAHVMKQYISLDTFKTDATQIVSQQQEAYNDSQLGFTGSLLTLKPATLYKFHMNDDVNYSFTGDFCKTDTLIPVKPGWNWIGYTGLSPAEINDALTSSIASENDMLVGQDGFSVFTNNEWVGTLNVLKPANGYLYYTNQTKTIYFTNPDSNSKKRKSKFIDNYSISQNNVVGLTDNHVRYAYPNVMGIIALLKNAHSIVNQGENHQQQAGISLQDKYDVIALDEKGKYRGVGQSRNGYFFITVYGLPGESISFQAISQDNSKLKINESFRFTSDVLGTVDKPIILTLSNFGDTTSVESADNVNSPTAKHVVACYSISGMFITTSPELLPSGIFIIKYSDGSSSKLIVK